MAWYWRLFGIVYVLGMLVFLAWREWYLAGRKGRRR